MGIGWKPVSDVVVVGGGPAGIAAAVASARGGARTVLVEQNGFVGGLATVGLPLHGFHNNRGERILGGIPRELVDRMIAMDYAAEGFNTAVGPPRGKGSPKYNARWIVYDPEAFKYVALEMLSESGVQVMVHTFTSDALVTNGEVRGILVDDKSGCAMLPAHRVVDCTGDGDVAARAGAPYEKGSESDGALQPMTPLFILGRVDAQAALASGAVVPSEQEVEGSAFWEASCHAYSVRLDRYASELRSEIPDFGHILTAFGAKDFGNGVWFCGNGLHIPGLDGSDGADLSAAEERSRTLIWRLVQFLRRHVPGFADARLVSTFPRIGVRETRRILGDYYLTYDDVQEGRQFGDAVALCGYRMDIHGYDGGPVYHEPESGTQVKDYGAYGIPYRCLLPRGVDNILVGGRPISASHLAHGSLRVMGTCMATGQAAGAAAALSLKVGVRPRDLPVHALRSVLREQGVLLGQGVPAGEGSR